MQQPRRPPSDHDGKAEALTVAGTQLQSNPTLGLRPGTRATRDTRGKIKEEGGFVGASEASDTLQSEGTDGESSEEEEEAN